MAEPTTPPNQPGAAPTPKPSPTPVPPVSGPLAGFEAWLYDLLVVKAPFQLPVAATDFIVKYGPWITLVIGILFLPTLFAIFTIAGLIGAVATTYGVLNPYGYHISPLYWVSWLVLLAQVVVMFVSIPKLLKRQRSGWMLLFYADCASLVYSVLNTITYGTVFGLIGALIGATVGFYILFQIRRYYVK